MTNATTASSMPKKRLVLVGAGHAHAQVLLTIAEQLKSEVEIVLVSPTALAPYSGMIPGWLAGHYEWEKCCIDFTHLCQKAGAALCIDSVSAIDPDRRLLSLSSGATLSYDWLSLNIGSTLRPEMQLSAPRSVHILAMRPLDKLQTQCEQLQASVIAMPSGADYHVVMVGGGAAGVESILAAHQRLTHIAPHVRCHFSLVTRGERILPRMPASAVRKIRLHLVKRKITLINNFAVDRIEHDNLVGRDGRKLPANAVLWATGAQAHHWPALSPISTDQDGFIKIDETLRSVSHPNVFATGDCARWAQQLPKAGVFAVRMGPVLTANLAAVINDKPLRGYRPQRRYLMLIGTGDTDAVAVWGSFSWQGAWVWRWKEKIDRAFLTRHNQ
jgi:pyridine nucleotide-disulfide oxidoreductase family protein